MEQLLQQAEETFNRINIPRDRLEIELRFGEFHGQNFISNIRSKDFYRILEHFQQPQFKPNEQNPVITTDYTYWMKERIRVSKTGSKTVYSTKKNIENIDFRDRFARLSFSKEELIPDPHIPGNLEPQSMRIKKRWSFRAIDVNHPFRPFRVDMTHVTGYNVTRDEKRSVNNYEIELELMEPSLQNYIWPAIRLMLKLLQNADIAVTSSTITNLIHSYNSLFYNEIAARTGSKQLSNHYRWNLFNPVNKPVNFKENDLYMPQNLTITDKADGERRLMYINQFGAFLLYPPKDVMLYIPRNPALDTLRDTIFDGELVSLPNGERVYLIFDLLILGGMNYMEVPFRARYEKIKEILKGGISGIELKRFYMPNEGDFYTRVNKVFEDIKTKGYENDGLVFNGINDPYSGKILKWKPPHLLTIDFKVDVSNDDVRLYVKDRREYPLFIGDQNHPFSGKIDESGLETGQIVEMHWDYTTGTFMAMRIRHDRDEPNNRTTALDVWKDIMNPVKEKTIHGHNLKMMRLKHNLIKRGMLEDSCKGRIIVDIGTGRGGDIHKWKHLGEGTSVLAIEPNKEYLAEFETRLTTSGYRSATTKKGIKSFSFDNNVNVSLLNAKGQDTELIVENYNRLFVDQPAGCVVIFNALTFFFESEDTLNKLFDTIDSLLDVGGRFLGMVMDGDRTRKLLGDKKKLNDYGWSITKKRFTNKPFGNEIVIHFGDDTIVHKQTEYLVDFEEFKELLKDRGIHFESSDFLSSDSSLSPSQARLNELYRTFVFVKKGEGDVHGDVITRFSPNPDVIFETVTDSPKPPQIKIANTLFDRIEHSNNKCIISAILKAKGSKVSYKARMKEYMKIFKEAFEEEDLFLNNHYEDWRDAKVVLSKCENWRWLKLWGLISDHEEINLKILIDNGPFIAPITYITGTVYPETITVYDHDGIYDLLHKSDKCASYVTDLEREYQRWRTVEGLVEYLLEQEKTSSKQYELLNILERFLLSLANLTVQLRIDPVLINLPLDHPIYRKMESEMRDKKITNISQIITHIQRTIRVFLSLKTEKSAEVKSRFSYKTFNQTLPNDRLRALEKRAEMCGLSRRETDVAITAMLMRYASMLSRGQQWNIPFKWYENVHKEFGVMIEGFASPLNSQLLLVGEDTHYCSLFKDTDAVFGSLGDIFKLNPELLVDKTIVINPPFIESLMDETAEMIQEWLGADPMRVILNTPEWSDARFYEDSLKSEYLVYETTLRKNKHGYEKIDPQKGLIYINAKFESHIFVFDSRLGEKEDYRGLLKYYVHQQ